jgi:hypothetical protein
LKDLPSQFKDKIYQASLKHFVFVLNDAVNEQENVQLNTLVNELKKGATNTYFKKNDICILPMSAKRLGNQFIQRPVDIWQKYLEINSRYFQTKNLQLGTKFSEGDI